MFPARYSIRIFKLRISCNLHKEAAGASSTVTAAHAANGPRSFHVLQGECHRTYSTMAAPGSQLLCDCCIKTFTLIVLAVLACTTANCIAGPLHAVALLQPSGSSPATRANGSSSNRTLIENSAVAFHNLTLVHQPYHHHLPSSSNRKLAFTHVHVDRSSLFNPPESQSNNGNWGAAAIKDGQLKRDQVPGALVHPSTSTWKHILSCVPLDCLTCLLSGLWGSSAAAVSWWSSRASLVSRSYKHLTQQEPFMKPHREPYSQVGDRELLDDTFPCRNADGAPVDWYTILKFPDGDHYAYIDSTFSPPAPGTSGPAGGYKWKVASGLAANATGPLAKTLLPLYGGQVRFHESSPVCSFCGVSVFVANCVHSKPCLFWASH
jgi:hypothetical protein